MGGTGAYGDDKVCENVARGLLQGDNAEYSASSCTTSPFHTCTTLANPSNATLDSFPGGTLGGMPVPGPGGRQPLWTLHRRGAERVTVLFGLSPLQNPQPYLLPYKYDPHTSSSDPIHALSAPLSPRCCVDNPRPHPAPIQDNLPLLRFSLLQIACGMHHVAGVASRVQPNGKMPEDGRRTRLVVRSRSN